MSSPQSNPSSPSTPSDEDVLASTLGRAAIITGVVSIVIGVIALVWPKATLLVVAILFAIELIVLGILRLTSLGALPPQPGWLKPLTIALGVITLIAGIVCLFRPNASLLIIAILLAVGWIAEGISSFVAGFSSGMSGGMRTYLIIVGIVLLVGGLLVAIFPGSTLVFLTRFSGILFILIGLVLVVTAMLARRELRKLADTP